MLLHLNSSYIYIYIYIYILSLMFEDKNDYVSLKTTIDAASAGVIYDLSCG